MMKAALFYVLTLFAFCLFPFALPEAVGLLFIL